MKISIIFIFYELVWNTIEFYFQMKINFSNFVISKILEKLEKRHIHIDDKIKLPEIYLYSKFHYAFFGNKEILYIKLVAVED